MHTLVVRLVVVLALAPLAEAQNFSFTVQSPLSATNIGARVDIDLPGTGIGDFDATNNTTGTRTCTTLFGTCNNTAIQFTNSLVIDSVLFGSPAGGFWATIDTDTGIAVISGFNVSPLGNQEGGADLTLNLLYPTFRTQQPNSLFIGGFNLPLPLGQIVVNNLALVQTADVPGALTPTAIADVYDFTALLPTNLSLGIDLLGNVGPIPFPLPVTGVLDLRGAKAVLTLNVDSSTMQTAPGPLDGQALEGIPLGLPTILPPGGVANLLFDFTPGDLALSFLADLDWTATGIALDPQPQEDDETYDWTEYLPSWGDNNDDCMNTRQEVLRAESRIPVTLGANGCSVIAGEWYDPYTDTVFTDPNELDIDHLVPLYEAHISGAASWSVEQKRAFANDLVDSNALIAVSASANRSKGSDDPALWLPPNQDYHCEYIRNWVGVKNAYGLSIDDDELAAIEHVLGDDIAHVSGFTQFGYQVNGEPTAARFSMGWTKNNGCAMYTKATDQDLLDLSVTIVPRAEDTGRPFNFYLLPVINGQMYTFTSAGMLIPIDVDPAQIIPFASSSFDSNFEVELFHGYVGAGFVIDLFLAYWVEGGDLIFTATPIRLLVE